MGLLNIQEFLLVHFLKKRDKASGYIKSSAKCGTLIIHLNCVTSIILLENEFQQSFAESIHNPLQALMK